MANRRRNVILTDEEIIHLYENGLSQQDIRSLYGGSIKRIRTVLQDAGYHTAIYRRVPLEYEQVICVLLHAGVSYRAIAEATDISYHVVRDIAERRPNKAVKKMQRKKRTSKTERESLFLYQYLYGTPFCVLSVSMHLTKNEILHCYTLLDRDIIHTHQTSLGCRLLAENLGENTVSSLAHKYGISTSTIKAHLNI